MPTDSEKSKQEQLDALLKVYLDNIYSFGRTRGTRVRDSVWDEGNKTYNPDRL